MKNFLIILAIAIALASCKNQTSLANEPQAKANQSIGSNSMAKPSIYNCQLIEKEFINKGGKVQEYKELYLRCSVQDYFIKLCASSVTKEQLLPYIDQGIQVEVEVRDGIWDHCSENDAHAQSRMGPYVVIKAIK